MRAEVAGAKRARPTEIAWKYRLHQMENDRIDTITITQQTKPRDIPCNSDETNSVSHAAPVFELRHGVNSNATWLSWCSFVIDHIFISYTETPFMSSPIL